MNHLFYSIITILFISLINCTNNNERAGSENLDIATPEGLAKEYIKVINGGGKFDDLKKIMVSEDEYIAISREAAKLQNPNNISPHVIDSIFKADTSLINSIRFRFKQKFNNFEKSWNEKNIYDILALRPYKYDSFSYQDKSVNRYYNVKIITLNKDHKDHTFELKVFQLELKVFQKVNDRWKLLYFIGGEY